MAQFLQHDSRERVFPASTAGLRGGTRTMCQEIATVLIFPASTARLRSGIFTLPFHRTC